MNNTQPRITRREALQLGLVAGVTLGGRRVIAASPPPNRSNAGSQDVGRGIVKVIKKAKADLVLSPVAQSGETLVSQIPYPFQVAPRLAAAFINLRLGFADSQDYEAGGDVALFDDLSRVGGRGIIPVTRNHREKNPNDGNSPSVMVKYPVNGGFVPLKALRADGSPHPHAGTGFATNQSRARPLTGDRYYNQDTRRFHQNHEVHQLSYDGSTFRVVETQAVPMDRILEGWTFHHAALGNAIPDGDDLLLPVAGKKTPVGGWGSSDASTMWRPMGSGVCRWRREGNRWRAVSFVMVTSCSDTDSWEEPSMVRDVNGSLLFCARDQRPNPNLRWREAKSESFLNDICVWKSTDQGATWKQIVHARMLICGPISLNQAADGTPYIASNLFEAQTWAMDPRFGRKDQDGRYVHAGWLREKLYLWPLNSARNGLEAPIVVRDCRSEFGQPPQGSTWIADHPTSSTVQLADGRWHGLIAYRILEAGERDNGLKPVPQTGAYVEEVVSNGAPRPAWRF